MVSSPAVVLARPMASRRVPPVAVSAKEVTGKLVGTILPSSWRSWGGQDLRAFLFWELLKSLRKAFKSMEKFLTPKRKKEGNRRALCIGGAAKA